MTRRGRSTTPFSLFAFQDIITSVTAIIILITLILTLELLSRELATGESHVSSTAAELRVSIQRAQADVVRLEAQLDSQSAAAEEISSFVAADIAREISATQQQIGSHKAELERLEGNLRAAQKLQAKAEAEAFDQQPKKVELADLEAQIEKARAKVKQLKEHNRLIYNPDSQRDKQAWLVDIGSDRILVARMNQSQELTTFRDSSDFLRWARQRNASQEYFVLLVRPSGIESHDTIETQLRLEQFEIGLDVIGETHTVIDTSGA